MYFVLFSCMPSSKLTVAGKSGPGVSLTLCCFVVYSTRRFFVCLTMCHFVLVFFSPFSIAITSLGEERANLSAFRTFVRFVLVWICRFPLPLGVWEGLRFVIVALPRLFSYLLFRCTYFVPVFSFIHRPRQEKMYILIFVIFVPSGDINLPQYPPRSQVRCFVNRMKKKKKKKKKKKNKEKKVAAYAIQKCA